MKFIVSVVILALAVCSEAGYIPAAYDYSYSAWPAAAHWGAAPWPAATYWGAHGPSLTTYPYGAAYPAAAYPAAAYPAGPYGYPHGPSTAIHADPAPHGHDGKYVAANRGSVHVAPLIGHIQSVKSTNLDPAPGTTW